MTSDTSKKLKAIKSIIPILFIFSTLSGILSSCNPIAETLESTGEVDFELTPTVEDPATQKLTLTAGLQIIEDIVV